MGFPRPDDYASQNMELWDLGVHQHIMASWPVCADRSAEELTCWLTRSNNEEVSLVVVAEIDGAKQTHHTRWLADSNNSLFPAHMRESLETLARTYGVQPYDHTGA